MSGGHFDYAYFKVNIFLEQLVEDIDLEEKEDQLKMLKMGLRIYQAKKDMRNIEWFMSGDSLLKEDQVEKIEFKEKQLTILVLKEDVQVYYEDDLVISLDDLDEDLQIEILKRIFIN